jgi:hypothetical protein
MYRPFDMDPSWDRHHNWNIRTDSRTLPQAAFPSLPLNHPPLASATSQPRTSSHPIDTTESDDDEFDESGIEDTTDDDTTDQMRPKLLMTIDTNPHFGRRDNLLPSTLISPEPSDITSMSLILRTEMPKTKSEPNTSYCATLTYFRRLGTHARYVLEA